MRVSAAARWELDAVRRWPRMRGFKWLEHCRDDHVIPPKVSLFASVQGAPDANKDLKRVHELAPLPGDNHNRSHTVQELRQHLRLCGAALGMEN